MSGNSLGRFFKATCFGESHGKALGAVIDGVPAGIKIDLHKIEYEMNRRKPGQSKLVTPRRESDQVEILSGLNSSFVTLGTPIALLIRNTNQRPQDYSAMEEIYRPGHADYTWEAKYGIREAAGGGRSSARVTAPLTAAGAIAKIILAHFTDIEILAYVCSAGGIKTQIDPEKLTLKQIEESAVRCPDPKASAQIENLILQKSKEGDSIGGVIECLIRGVPAGLGEPIFDKLDADLAKALLGINAVKGIEFGAGFKAAEMFGSEHNDPFVSAPSGPATKSNNAGGVLGGISSGMPIVFRAVFKPTATIAQKQQTINRKGEDVELAAKGRHDPCVLPRAVPIVEAAAALTLCDHFLMQTKQLWCAQNGK